MSWYEAAKDVVKGTARIVVPPIKAEVTYLTYEETRNNPSSSVVVVSAHPERYFARIELTNASPAAAFVKLMTLSLNGGKRVVWSESAPMRFEAGEPRTEDIIFPVSRDHEQINEGEFELEIIPSLGRSTIIKGSFPLEEREG